MHPNILSTLQNRPNCKIHHAVFHVVNNGRRNNNIYRGHAGPWEKICHRVWQMWKVGNENRKSNRHVSEKGEVFGCMYIKACKNGPTLIFLGVEYRLSIKKSSCLQPHLLIQKRSLSLTQCEKMASLLRKFKDPSKTTTSAYELSLTQSVTLSRATPVHKRTEVIKLPRCARRTRQNRAVNCHRTENNTAHQGRTRSALLQTVSKFINAKQQLA